MTTTDITLEQAGARRSEPAPTARDAMEGEHAPMRSLYIHTPFCAHKCHYCDFYSFVDTQDRQEAFTTALEIELRALASLAERGGGARGSRKPALQTVFVGGGTPSLLRVALWERLLTALHDAFDMTRIEQGTDGAEFTVECNPERTTPELLGALRAGGVNRVSLGAQSFREAHLRTLERRHTPGNVARALRLAAEAGIGRRSIDLIYGVPGQTLEEWRADVETALALSPGVEHLSCYALTYEPNTPMTARLGRGEFSRCDDGLEADMYEWLVERTRDAGFERYEVSNFSRGAGARSEHNMAYWRQDAWLAAGPSASAHAPLADGRAGGWRWKNVARLGDWIESVIATGGWSSVTDLEPPEPRRALRERIMMGLRIAEGLDGAGVRADAAALGAGAEFSRAVDRQREAGRLVEAGGRIALTDAGFLFADAVARDLMRAIRG